MGQVLAWGGLLLLLAGSLLVRSYLVAPPSTSMPSTPRPTAVTPKAVPTFAPTATITPTNGPLPTPSLTPTLAIPTRIVIPVIDLDAPVVPVSWDPVEVNGQTQAIWQIPDTRAAGWHETSAPLGVVGNTVFNGHNTAHGEVFRDLYKLEEGDEIVVYAVETPHTYAVGEVLILPEAGQPLEVRIENAQYILETKDERLTLVTCHPYGSTRNRLIVIAYP